LQPQLPDTQAWPLALAEQSWHTAPDEPHALPMVPPWHVPLLADEQHPPLHVCVDEHMVVQACVPVLHA
jgi:hypothetical protein